MTFPFTPADPEPDPFQRPDAMPPPPMPAWADPATAPAAPPRRHRRPGPRPGAARPGVRHGAHRLAAERHARRGRHRLRRHVAASGPGRHDAGHGHGPHDEHDHRPGAGPDRGDCRGAEVRRHDHDRRQHDRGLLAVRSADGRRRLGRHPHRQRLHPHQSSRRRGRADPERGAPGRHDLRREAHRALRRHRSRAHQGRRDRPHARPHLRLGRGRRRSDDARDRQPARDVHRDGHPRDPLRRRPRGHRDRRAHPPRDDPHRPDPDGRGDQPRQLRRSAARRERRRHRHQHRRRGRAPKAWASRSRSTTPRTSFPRQRRASGPDRPAHNGHRSVSPSPDSR